MANSLLTSTLVLNEIGRKYYNKLKFITNTNRSYDDRFRIGGTKGGNTAYVRMPTRVVTGVGQAVVPQNLYDQAVAITLGPQINAACEWSSRQAGMEVSEANARYIEPMANALSAKADSYAYSECYRDVYNIVGTPGTSTTALVSYMEARIKIQDGGGPSDGLVALLDGMNMIGVAAVAQVGFNPQNVQSETYKKGALSGMQFGIDAWYESTTRPTHTSGTYTSCQPHVTGALQTGSTLNTHGWASGATTLKRGDAFTIAGTYSVNYETGDSTGRLQQFTITADAADSTGTIAALGISPPIITSGALKTVSNSPADAAVITVVGSTNTEAGAAGILATTVRPVSMIFHPDAFAVVSADLPEPTAGCEARFIRNKQTGVNIRMIEQFQFLSDQNPTRLDLLIGAATLQARLACRVAG